jgi:hypothetical protein
MPARLTQKVARASVSELGFSFKRTDYGDFCIRCKASGADYHSDDLRDIVDTAAAWRRREESARTQTELQEIIAARRAKLETLAKIDAALPLGFVAFNRTTCLALSVRADGLAFNVCQPENATVCLVKSGLPYGVADGNGSSFEIMPVAEAATLALASLEKVATDVARMLDK